MTEILLANYRFCCKVKNHVMFIENGNAFFGTHNDLIKNYRRFLDTANTNN